MHKILLRLTMGLAAFVLGVLALYTKAVVVDDGLWSDSLPVLVILLCLLGSYGFLSGCYWLFTVPDPVLRLPGVLLVVCCGFHSWAYVVDPTAPTRLFLPILEYLTPVGVFLLTLIGPFSKLLVNSLCGVILSAAPFVGKLSAFLSFFYSGASQCLRFFFDAFAYGSSLLAIALGGPSPGTAPLTEWAAPLFFQVFVLGFWVACVYIFWRKCAALGGLFEWLRVRLTSPVTLPADPGRLRRSLSGGLSRVLALYKLLSRRAFSALGSAKLPDPGRLRRSLSGGLSRVLALYKLLSRRAFSALGSAKLPDPGRLRRSLSGGLSRVLALYKLLSRRAVLYDSGSAKLPDAGRLRRSLIFALGSAKLPDAGRLRRSLLGSWEHAWSPCEKRLRRAALVVLGSVGDRVRLPEVASFQLPLNFWVRFALLASRSLLEVLLNCLLFFWVMAVVFGRIAYSVEKLVRSLVPLALAVLRVCSGALPSAFDLVQQGLRWAAVFSLSWVTDWVCDWVSGAFLLSLVSLRFLRWAWWEMFLLAKESSFYTVFYVPLFFLEPFLLTPRLHARRLRRVRAYIKHSYSLNPADKAWIRGSHDGWFLRIEPTEDDGPKTLKDIFEEEWVPQHTYALDCLDWAKDNLRSEDYFDIDAALEEPDIFLDIRYFWGQCQAWFAKTRALYHIFAIPHDLYYRFRWTLGKLASDPSFDHTAYGPGPQDPFTEVRVSIPFTGLFKGARRLRGSGWKGYFIVMSFLGAWTQFFLGGLYFFLEFLKEGARVLYRPWLGLCGEVAASWRLHAQPVVPAVYRLGHQLLAAVFFDTPQRVAFLKEIRFPISCRVLSIASCLMFATLWQVGTFLVSVVSLFIVPTTISSVTFFLILGVAQALGFILLYVTWLVSFVALYAFALVPPVALIIEAVAKFTIQTVRWLASPAAGFFVGPLFSFVLELARRVVGAVVPAFIGISVHFITKTIPSLFWWGRIRLGWAADLAINWSTKTLPYVTWLLGRFLEYLVAPWNIIRDAEKYCQPFYEEYYQPFRSWSLLRVRGAACWVYYGVRPTLCALRARLSIKVSRLYTPFLACFTLFVSCTPCSMFVAWLLVGDLFGRVSGEECFGWGLFCLALYCYVAPCSAEYDKLLRAGCRRVYGAVFIWTRHGALLRYRSVCSIIQFGYRAFRARLSSASNSAQRLVCVSWSHLRRICLLLLVSLARLWRVYLGIELVLGRALVQKLSQLRPYSWVLVIVSLASFVIVLSAVVCKLFFESLADVPALRPIFGIITSLHALHAPGNVLDVAWLAGALAFFRVSLPVIVPYSRRALRVFGLFFSSEKRGIIIFRNSTVYRQICRLFLFFQVFPLEYDDLVDYFWEGLVYRPAERGHGIWRAITNYFFRYHVMMFWRKGLRFFIVWRFARPWGSGRQYFFPPRYLAPILGSIDFFAASFIWGLVWSPLSTLLWAFSVPFRGVDHLVRGIIWRTSRRVAARLRKPERYLWEGIALFRMLFSLVPLRAPSVYYWWCIGCAKVGLWWERLLLSASRFPRFSYALSSGGLWCLFAWAIPRFFLFVKTLIAFLISGQGLAPAIRSFALRMPGTFRYCALAATRASRAGLAGAWVATIPSLLAPYAWALVRFCLAGLGFGPRCSPFVVALLVNHRKRTASRLGYYLSRLFLHSLVGFAAAFAWGSLALISCLGFLRDRSVFLFFVFCRRFPQAWASFRDSLFAACSGSTARTLTVAPELISACARRIACVVGACWGVVSWPHAFGFFQSELFFRRSQGGYFGLRRVSKEVFQPLLAAAAWAVVVWNNSWKSHTADTYSHVRRRVVVSFFRKKKALEGDINLGLGLLYSCASPRGRDKFVGRDWLPLGFGTMGQLSSFWKGWPSAGTNFLAKRGLGSWVAKASTRPGEQHDARIRAGLCSCASLLYVAVLAFFASKFFWFAVFPAVSLSLFLVLLLFDGFMHTTSEFVSYACWFFGTMWDALAITPWDLLKERRLMHGLNKWGEFFDPRLLEIGDGIRSLLTRQCVTNEFYAYNVIPYAVVGPLSCIVFFDSGTDRPDWAARDAAGELHRPIPLTIWELAFRLDLRALVSFFIWGTTFHTNTRYQSTYAPRKLKTNGLSIHRFSVRDYIFRSWYHWGVGWGSDAADAWRTNPWYTTFLYLLMPPEGDWIFPRTRFYERFNHAAHRHMSYGDWAVLPENTRLSVMMGGFSQSLRDAARQGGWGLESGDFSIVHPLWGLSFGKAFGHKMHKRFLRYPWGRNGSHIPIMERHRELSRYVVRPLHHMAFPFYHKPRPRFYRPWTGVGWDPNTVQAEFVERGSLFFKQPKSDVYYRWRESGFQAYRNWFTNVLSRKVFRTRVMAEDQMAFRRRLMTRRWRDQLRFLKLNILSPTITNKLDVNWYFPRLNRRRGEGVSGLTLYDTDLLRRNDLISSTEPWNERYFHYLTLISDMYPREFLPRHPKTQVLQMPPDDLWGLWPGEDSMLGDFVWTSGALRWENLGTRHVGRSWKPLFYYSDYDNFEDNEWLHNWNSNHLLRSRSGDPFWSPYFFGKHKSRFHEPEERRGAVVRPSMGGRRLCFHLRDNLIPGMEQRGTLLPPSVRNLEGTKMLQRFIMRDLKRYNYFRDFPITPGNPECKPTQKDCYRQWAHGLDPCYTRLPNYWGFNWITPPALIKERYSDRYVVKTYFDIPKWGHKFRWSNLLDVPQSSKSTRWWLTSMAFRVQRHRHNVNRVREWIWSDKIENTWSGAKKSVGLGLHDVYFDQWYNTRPPFKFVESVKGWAKTRSPALKILVDHPSYIGWRNFFLRYLIQDYRKIFNATLNKVPLSGVYWTKLADVIGSMWVSYWYGFSLAYRYTGGWTVPRTPWSALKYLFGKPVTNNRWDGRIIGEPHVWDRWRGLLTGSNLRMAWYPTKFSCVERYRSHACWSAVSEVEHFQLVYSPWWKLVRFSFVNTIEWFYKHAISSQSGLDSRYPVSTTRQLGSDEFERSGHLRFVSDHVAAIRADVGVQDLQEFGPRPRIFRHFIARFIGWSFEATGDQWRFKYILYPRVWDYWTRILAEYHLTLPRQQWYARRMVGRYGGPMRRRWYRHYKRRKWRGLNRYLNERYTRRETVYCAKDMKLAESQEKLKKVGAHFPRINYVYSRRPDSFLEMPEFNQLQGDLPHLIGARDLWFGTTQRPPFFPAAIQAHSIFRRSLFKEGCQPVYFDYTPWLPVFPDYGRARVVEHCMLAGCGFPDEWGMRTAYWYNLAYQHLGLRDYRLVIWLLGSCSQNPGRFQKVPPCLEYFGISNKKKHPILFSPGTELVNAQADLMVMCGLSCVY